ncbi:hypothetical protein AgCh_022658 [Apium graveolens]
MKEENGRPKSKRIDIWNKTYSQVGSGVDENGNPIHYTTQIAMKIDEKGVDQINFESELEPFDCWLQATTPGLSKTKKSRLIGYPRVPVCHLLQDITQNYKERIINNGGYPIEGSWQELRETYRKRVDENGNLIHYTTQTAMKIDVRYLAILKEKGVDQINFESELEPFDCWLQATTPGLRNTKKGRLIGYPRVPSCHLLQDITQNYKERIMDNGGYPIEGKILPFFVYKLQNLRMLTECFFSLESELEKAENEVIGREKRKLDLFDNLVVLEGLVDPSEF